ncbi:MAG: hypothetical protein ACYCPA_12475 [Acidithiobacillus sp.]
MSILFNLFTPLDEVAEYLPGIAPANPNDRADPYWRRGFFMALQAAPFYCPANHPLVTLSEWLFDVGWAPLWQEPPSAGLGMAGGDCDEFNGDALKKAEAGAAVMWRYFLSMAAAR